MQVSQSSSTRSAFAIRLADELERTAADLAAHWRDRARFVAPRRAAADDAVAQCPDADGPEIVRALAGALRADPASHDALMRSGWRYGSSCRAADLSLHLVLKELELLSAITLFACERAAEGDGTASAADGLRVARDIQRSISVLIVAAAKGFTHAYMTEVHDRYRTLRHDLRNPIGTIKSAVSFMEDESVAPELRSHPRFRAMVQRNALSLETLIRKRLTTEGAAPAFVERNVALRDVALAVRRTVREEAEAAGCEVQLAEEMPACATDAIGVELALASIVGAAIRALGQGGTIRIEADQPSGGLLTVTVRSRTRDSAPVAIDAGSLGFAREMAELWGGHLLSGDEVQLEIPLLPERDESTTAPARGATPLSIAAVASVDSRDNLARAD